MRNFIIAIQFLTRISLRPDMQITGADFAHSSSMYPVVGAVIGLLSIISFLAGSLVSPLVGSALTLTIYLLLTGGLHLDGLLDWADGFFSYRPKERIIEIMKDSRVGANGVLVAITIVLLKFSLIAALSSQLHFLLLIIAPMLSRWAAVFLSFKFPYVNHNQGLGKTVGEHLCPADFKFASISCLVLLITISGINQSWRALLMALALWGLTVLIARAMGQLAVGRIDGITGDVIGACIELVDVGVLLVGVIIGVIL